jgi:hypothetical protein
MSHDDCPNNKAAVVNGEYISGCKACINTRQQSSDYAARFKREAMKKDYRKDVLQRYDGDKVNPEWVKEYPDKALEEFGQDKVTDILRGV